MTLDGAFDRGRDLVPAEGGDPACWLERVCDECGLLVEGEATTCPRCGAAR